MTDYAHPRIEINPGELDPHQGFREELKHLIPVLVASGAVVAATSICILSAVASQEGSLEEALAKLSTLIP
ncbi:hypothetical protein A3A66_04780 [Microgenomates group bacterium RIFCSPLOWO2_01_FULL_46_13]|nr:MAG: hypothetical protein A2783_00240 [Microgenomates group bacterium RIFCSPHIGHO2_01_FULL_45_11]OGV94281.1 MAG: hypothetical protein A3A66_04780 [Microgenomates group bacterium RIFCSPLOWO2_01_FULL_46_13]